MHLQNFHRVSKVLLSIYYYIDNLRKIAEHNVILSNYVCISFFSVFLDYFKSTVNFLLLNQSTNQSQYSIHNQKPPLKLDEYFLGAHNAEFTDLKNLPVIILLLLLPYYKIFRKRNTDL